MRTLNDLLDDSVKRGPHRTALVLAEDPSKGRKERSVSYSKLSKTVLQAAAAFRARGITPGDRVAVVHRNGLGFVVAYFGLARLGAAAVPVNFLVQKTEELRYMLEHSGAKAVVTEREFLKGVLSAKAGLPGLKSVWVTDADAGTGPVPEGAEDFWHFLDGHAPLPEDEAQGPAPGDTACILYTSGTTGRSKGVMLTHANLCSNVEACIRALDLRPSDAILCILPMFHTFAWTACVLVGLRLGGRVVVVPSITPAAPWLKLMGRQGVTLFAAVPQVYGVLAKQAAGLKRWFLRLWSFRRVRMCISGAAPLSASTREEFRRALGMDILEGYGLTETSPVATINRPRQARAGSVGLPIEGVEVRLVDEAGKTLPPGGEGEILLRGPNVMKGYFQDAESTAQAVDSEGWLRTGDVGAVDEEGFLYIRDRKKDMIIVKGLKVFSAQVESVLLAHPSVAEAAVIGVPDESGDETIKAFVVPREGSSLDKGELLRFCRERLDPYKRPRDVELAHELPKNALQKVLKRVLRERELAKRGT